MKPMRKINNRYINMALIFTLIGVFLCQDLYALRVPMTGHKKVKQTLASGQDNHAEESLESDLEEALREAQSTIKQGLPLFHPVREKLDLKLDEFLQSRGFDVFMNSMQRYYSYYADPKMKRFISGMMNLAIYSVYADPDTELLQGLTVDMLKPYLDFFVDIALAPTKRTLSHIINSAIRRSPSGKIIMYQNKRLGAIYPIMEQDMRDLLASKGFPVFEIDLDNVNLKEIRTNPEFKKARIILARFKVSSLGGKMITAESQRRKFEALRILGGDEMPIIMVDYSVREISEAQIAVKESFPEIEMFNADIFYPAGGNYYDLLDNMDLLLPAGTPDGQNGELYDEFGRKMAKALSEDTAFWKKIDGKTLASGQEVKILGAREGVMQVIAKIKEVATANQDADDYRIMLLIDGQHNIGKSTFSETMRSNLKIPGWHMKTTGPIAKRDITIEQAWNVIGTEEDHLIFKKWPGVTVIAVYLSETDDISAIAKDDTSGLKERVLKHANFIIDWRKEVRLDASRELPELLRQLSSSQKDL